MNAEQLKILRNPVCAACDGRFKIIPDSITDEELDKIAGEFKEAGNVTICHHCGAPLEFVPAVSSKWEIINPKTMHSLPLTALTGLLESMISVANHKQKKDLIEPIMRLVELINLRHSAGLIEGVKCDNRTFKGSDIYGKPSNN